MDQLSVKKLSTLLVGLFIFALMLSGIYNTFYVDFHISQNVFDESKFSISNVDYTRKKKVQRKERPRRSYSDRVKTFASAARTEDVVEKEKNTVEQAHIKSELNLELAEFFNAKKFKKVLKGGEAEGSLTARDGVIESLEIYLPNNDEITAQFAEMNGNVFTYHYDDNIFSGLIYQSGDAGYTVTLVNGPYQGSKMKFVSRDSGQRALSYDETLGYEERAYEEQREEREKENNFYDEKITDSEKRDDYSEEEFIDEKPSFADEVFEQASNEEVQGGYDFSDGA